MYILASRGAENATTHTRTNANATWKGMVLLLQAKPVQGLLLTSYPPKGLLATQQVEGEGVPGLTPTSIHHEMAGCNYLHTPYDKTFCLPV
jgi:hypothetical protein